MRTPNETPDGFGPPYDPPVPVGTTKATDIYESKRAVGASSAADPQPTTRRNQIAYAAPGSTNNSMNPASTVAFMLNMGYPPPPIALEPLRRLMEQMTQGPGQVLNLQLALHITDEISRSPYRIAPAVLFVLQQRLHSSKPDRVCLALELLDMCVKNCGLDFVRHINKEFMKSLVSVVKTTTFKERTITGQLKRLEKYLIGSPTTTGVATDPRVHKLKKKCLTMIQNWSDAFIMHPQQVQPILDTYRSLRRKGVQFPPKDAAQRFLVKHAETSPAFDGSFPSDEAASSVLSVEADLTRESSVDVPFSSAQFSQFEKLINLLKTSDSPTLIQDALDMCDRLRPKLEDSLKLLQSKLNASGSRKLRGSDPRVAQLNAILDLDAEIRRRRGTPLLFTGISAEPKTDTNHAKGPVKPAQTSSINLLDDLLNSDDNIPQRAVPSEYMKTMDVAVVEENEIWPGAKASATDATFLADSKCTRSNNFCSATLSDFFGNVATVVESSKTDPVPEMRQTNTFGNSALDSLDPFTKQSIMSSDEGFASTPSEQDLFEAKSIPDIDEDLFHSITNQQMAKTKLCGTGVLSDSSSLRETTPISKGIRDPLRTDYECIGTQDYIKNSQAEITNLNSSEESILNAAECIRSAKEPKEVGSIPLSQGLKTEPSWFTEEPDMFAASSSPEGMQKKQRPEMQLESVNSTKKTRSTSPFVQSAPITWDQ